MKNILFLLIISVIATFFSCGTSLKDKLDKVDKAKQDSLARIDSIEMINPYFKYLGNWSTTDSSKNIEIYATDSNYCYIMLKYNKSDLGELLMSNSRPLILKVSGKDGSLISPNSDLISYNKNSYCIVYENENYFKDNKSDILYEIQFVGFDGDLHAVSQNLICMPGSKDPTIVYRVKK